MKKVLIVTYYWPPSGGAGVQRWLKFAKYLPGFGWEPVILTVDPFHAAYPVTDESLEGDVPVSLRVIRTKATDWFAPYRKDRTKIPSAGFASAPDNSLMGKLMRFARGNFFIPDPRRGWNRHALRKACELIEKEQITTLISTSPPHSTQLIGLKLKKRYPSLRWVADLRDPWTDIYYYKQFYPTLIPKSIDSAYEKSVLMQADGIITVGESLLRLFAEKCPAAEKKMTVISNGFDEDDFRPGQSQDPSRFTITYVGTLSDIYPLDGLASSVKELSQIEPGLLLRFAGSVSPSQKELLTSLLPASCLQFLPYSPHDEAVGYMMSSSILVLIIPRHGTSKSIVTGKIFEYIGSGKPVLCIGPEDGDAAAIISGAGSGVCCGYDDRQKMLAFMKSVLERNFTVTASDTSAYSRKNLTARLSEVLK